MLRRSTIVSNRTWSPIQPNRTLPSVSPIAPCLRKSRSNANRPSAGWRRHLKAGNWQAGLAIEPADPAPSAIAVPLPKPRPVETALATNNAAPAAQPNDRTLLQKLSDLLPARLTLASLAPNGGLFSKGPDLAALGYDSLTAVYDISARTVYMPNGAKLEAHSGMGALMDDPRYVGERDVGPTPPNVYDLKPRERPFHGVKALRMIPQDESATLGRDGLLTHSYLLGPNGDSNGCVSFKNYDKFLTAFQNGEVKRLVVVISLNDVRIGVAQGGLAVLTDAREPTSTDTPRNIMATTRTSSSPIAAARAVRACRTTRCCHCERSAGDIRRMANGS